MLKYSVCLWLINHINHVIWTNQTVQDDFFFLYIFWLSCHCMFHRSPLWTTDVSLLLPNGWWWSSCQPVTSVSFPHAHRKSSPSLQVICISYISHSMRILQNIICAHVYQNFKKNQAAKVCNLLPLGAQFRICRYCINIYVSVPNFTHRCVMCDEYI